MYTPFIVQVIHMTNAVGTIFRQNERQSRDYKEKSRLTTQENKSLWGLLFRDIAEISPK
jgi:hypothetical protein